MRDKRDRAAHRHPLVKLGGLMEQELSAELGRLLDERASIEGGKEEAARVVTIELTDDEPFTTEDP